MAVKRDKTGQSWYPPYQPMRIGKAYRVCIWWPSATDWGGVSSYDSFKDAWRHVVWCLDNGYGDVDRQDLQNRSEIWLKQDKLKQKVEYKPLAVDTAI